MNLKKMFVFVFSALLPIMAHAKLNVVTSTEDLAALTKEIGGDLVSVESIAKGYQDPHFVDAKPSYLLKLKHADLFIEVGLELEIAWAPQLLTNARNQNILPGHSGFMEASEGCAILQRPTGGVDRTMGDVHPFGNPHYWLDPANGLIIANHIKEKLTTLDPQNTKNYEDNFARFKSTLNTKEKEWDAMAKSFKDSKIITYHNSWPNFASRFGLNVVNHIEPKPGIPPSPNHMAELIKQMKAENVRVIIMEPYFDDKFPNKVAYETGAQLLILAPSVGADKNIKTYFDLFDEDLKLLSSAFARKS